MFVLDPHWLPLHQAMGVHREEMAALRFAELDEPGNATFLAQTRNRLSGLLSLGPDLPISAWSNRYIWSVKHLVIASDAPSRTISTLVEKVSRTFAKRMDCLIARVPATDGAAIKGLRRTGFRVVGCEINTVLSCEQTDPREPPSVSFVPLELRHVPAATAIALSSNSYRWLEDSCLRSAVLPHLYKFLLTGQVKDPHYRGLVAEGASGGLLGFVTFTRDFLFEKYCERRMASIESFGMRPQAQYAGLGEMLVRQALSNLTRRSVDLVSVKTVMDGPDPTSTLRMYRALGGRPGVSTLIMCRWNKRT